MIRTLALVSMTVLTLAACQQPAEPAPAPTEPPVTTPTPPVDANALTAEGWGPLRIGMTLAEITAVLGPDADPKAVGGADPAACDQFRPERAPEGMLLMVEQGRLTRISIGRANTLKTDRGFGLGDSAAAIKTAYGAAAVATPHKYQDAPAEYITAWSGAAPTPDTPTPDTARGIVYEIGGEGTVTAIHAGGPSIQYVEGCS
ncbi:MAG: hypothetical protein V4707_04660 [Pseudomonadota bacterium]